MSGKQRRCLASAAQPTWVMLALGHPGGVEGIEEALAASGFVVRHEAAGAALDPVLGSLEKAFRRRRTAHPSDVGGALVLMLERTESGQNLDHQSPVFFAPPKAWVMFDQYIYFPARRQVEIENRPVVDLTASEATLLELFLRAPNVPLHRNEIMKELGRSETHWDARMIDREVCKLRRKLGLNPGARGTPLRTCRGIGYMLVTERLDDHP